MKKRTKKSSAKKATNEMLRTLLSIALFLLVLAGVGAGVFLAGQNQDLRNQAKQVKNEDAWARVSLNPMGTKDLPARVKADNEIFVQVTYQVSGNNVVDVTMKHRTVGVMKDGTYREFPWETKTTKFDPATSSSYIDWASINSYCKQSLYDACFLHVQVTDSDHLLTPPADVWAYYKPVK